jgi:pilus assembly protein CpaE
MSGRTLRAVVITPDAALRETVQEFSRNPRNRITVTLDLSLGFEQFSSQQVKAVRQSAPALVFLDLESDQRLGLSLAAHLAGMSSDLLVVAVGPALSADVLLEAMRSGVSEFLPKPVDAEALAEAVARLRPRLGAESEGAEGLGQVHAVFGAKGGVGSSLVATNVAIEARRALGQRVLLLDLDPELGDLSLMLGMKPELNFVDLIQDVHRMEAGILRSYIGSHDSGVHLLAAPYHPDPTALVAGDQVRKILLHLRRQYDHVFVGTPKSFGATTLPVFEVADDVLLVATLDLPSLRNIQRTLPLLERVLPRGREQLRLVINRYDPDQELTPKDVERSLGLPVYATLSEDVEAVMRSLTAAKPLALDGRSAFARDVKALVGRLLQVDAPGKADRPSVSGLFARLNLGRKGT